jgi:hypothetical protein
VVAVFFTASRCRNRGDPTRLFRRWEGQFVFAALYLTWRFGGGYLLFNYP